MLFLHKVRCYGSVIIITIKIINKFCISVNLIILSHDQKYMIMKTASLVCLILSVRKWTTVTIVIVCFL